MDKLTPRQEKFMQALAVTPNVTEASRLAGIARTTGQKYLADVTFRKAWRKYRTETMQQTTAKLQQTSLEAVEVLRAIMLDDSVSPYARQQAAHSVLAMAYKAHELTDILEVVEELETAVYHED